jgi:alpha-L-fucosidase
MKQLLSILLLTPILCLAQHKYVAPKDTLVQKNLSRWQDMKFGLLMHWGTYSQWGIVESWSICPEDEGWTQRRGPYSKNYNEYVKAYEDLQITFNPVKFAPEKWAEAAADAGMKYVIFTTKHHDGFCMFDTKETDYKITSARTPYSSNPRSNVAKEIFNAFRQKGFITGAYFSKPDWHNENYWWPYFPPKDRNVNYDPVRYPDKWNAFKDYTYRQIKELMSEYGKMDILWLDGGWVRPLSSVDTSIEWQRGIKYNQDIDMNKIASMARGYQPGLIIVDRSVTGEFENYTTPEQEVPKEPLPYPWETCMTMAGSWSYVPNDNYKSTHQLIELLVRIVAKGGNLLLNIGPSPDGDWDPAAYNRLKEIGEWMKVNSEAIYATKPFPPYSSGNICYTQSKDGNNIYVIWLSDNALINTKTIILKGINIPAGSSIKLLGNNKSLKWQNNKDNDNTTIIQLPVIPASCHHALVLKIQKKSIK